MAQIESAWSAHPDYRIDLVPIRAGVKVRVDGVVLAESHRAVRLIETRHVERLYIPVEDVKVEGLVRSDTRTVCPFKGQASYWSFMAPTGPGDDIFWEYQDPLPEVAAIKGYLGVYHEKSDVDIETRWPDGMLSSNRFPAWGDQADLMRLIDVTAVGSGRYSAPGYHWQDRDVVEGGQLLGQVIVAASKDNPGQRVSWVSINFVKAASFALNLDLEVVSIRRGRTFSTLQVNTTQSDRLVATALVLMDSGSPDVIRGVEEMPSVAGPVEAEPFDLGVVGRDLRVVDGAYGQDPGRLGPPLINAWIRFLEDRDDSGIRSGLIAQATTHWTIAAAMLPHPGFGEAKAHISVSTGPVAMSIAFHDDAPVDEWLLYSNPVIWAGKGLALGQGRIFTKDGILVASYHLEAMIRELIPQAEGKGFKNAM